MMKTWLSLLMAIFIEVIATSLLKASDGFRIWKLAVLSLALYAVSFYLLSLALTSIPLGVAYAIWSGLGIFAVTLIGIIIYHDQITTAGYLGVSLIILGVVITSLSMQK